MKTSITEFTIQPRRRRTRQDSEKKSAVDGISTTQPMFRLRYDRGAAAETLSISIRTLDYRISQGLIKVKREGDHIVITHDELVRYARVDHPSPVHSAAKTSKKKMEICGEGEELKRAA